MLPRRLFLYGTLMAGSGNPVAAALHRLLGPGRAASLRGALFALPDPRGWYPALLPDGADTEVRGFVHETLPGFGPDDLARLDAYEGCDPGDPGAGDYVRRAVTVRIGDGTQLPAQAWLWNRALPAGSLPVPDGDFAAFLEANGLRAFAPDG